MTDPGDKEVIEAVKKLQWALGEAVFRTEKLKRNVSSQDNSLPELLLYLFEGPFFLPCSSPLKKDH